MSRRVPGPHSADARGCGSIGPSFSRASTRWDADVRLESTTVGRGGGSLPPLTTGRCQSEPASVHWIVATLLADSDKNHMRCWISSKIDLGPLADHATLCVTLTACTLRWTPSRR